MGDGTAAACERERAALRARRRVQAGALFSLGAGAIHGVAVGSHGDTRWAAVAFAVLAAAQLGWAAWAMADQGRRVAAAGVGLHLAAMAGWVAAVDRGIAFVPGLTAPESPGLPDLAAALLAALAALAVLASMSVASGLVGEAPEPSPRPTVHEMEELSPPVTAGAGWSPPVSGTGRRRRAGAGVATAAAVTAVLAVPAMVAAAGHRAAAATSAAGYHHGTAAVAPSPYVPGQPVDLSGVPGVTPAQQARAENLVETSLAYLPRFQDPAAAEAAGYHSIGDESTGYVHYVNWDDLADGHVLDATHPESVVYRVSPQAGLTLVAAMYMLPPGSSLAGAPDIGGALTQWHIHDNLCFDSTRPDRVVMGLTDSAGRCPGGAIRLEPVPMIHVWIVPNPCGPFAALEGVSGGQVAPGQQQACDHVHGT
jgi:hypothetical protein